MCKNNSQEVLKEYRKIYNNEDGVFQQLKKLHKENPYTVEDHVLNNSKICFLIYEKMEHSLAVLCLTLHHSAFGCKCEIRQFLFCFSSAFCCCHFDIDPQNHRNTLFSNRQTARRTVFGLFFRPGCTAYRNKSVFIKGLDYFHRQVCAV